MAEKATYTISDAKKSDSKISFTVSKEPIKEDSQKPLLSLKSKLIIAAILVGCGIIYNLINSISKTPASGLIEAYKAEFDRDFENICSDSSLLGEFEAVKDEKWQNAKPERLDKYYFRGWRVSKVDINLKNPEGKVVAASCYYTHTSNSIITTKGFEIEGWNFDNITGVPMKVSDLRDYDSVADERKSDERENRCIVAKTFEAALNGEIKKPTVGFEGVSCTQFEDTDELWNKYENTEIDGHNRDYYYNLLPY